MNEKVNKKNLSLLLRNNCKLKRDLPIRQRGKVSKSLDVSTDKPFNFTVAGKPVVKR